jgi:membrane-bound ClpP family serine protease
MPPLPKYILMQVPGAILLGVILLMLRAEGWLAANTALVILALWLLRDAILYPWFRPALKDSAPEGVEALIGEPGTCLTRINGSGLVQVRGEHWQARTHADRPIEAGDAIKVVDHKGHVLWVEPARRAGARTGEPG